LDSIVQLDKKEWEAFLEKLSELEKKYQLVLRELDEAHRKLLALDTSPRQQEQTPPHPATPAEQQPTQTPTGPKKRGLLIALETKLQSLRTPPAVRARRSLTIPNAPRNYASCSRCRNKIMQATRFCQRCGADFRKWVCSCGRELSRSDKFCYHCGHIVELQNEAA